MAFDAIARQVKATGAERIGAIAGELAAVEEIFALKDLMTRLGVSNLDCREDSSALDPKWGRASYIFNPTIAGIETADHLMLIGSNPRREAPIINARIRKRWRTGKLKVSLIGERADLTYDYDYLGAGPETLATIRPSADTGRPIWLIGQGALSRKDGLAILSLSAKSALAAGAIQDGWNGFGVLHTAASRVGALDLGFVPGPGGHGALDMAAPDAVDVIFLLGADEIEVEPGAFVVYIGTHGDRGAHRADVILPGAAYPEKSGIFVNTEGRVQAAPRASFPPGDAREDWAILRALSDVLGHKLPYDSLAQLRNALFRKHAHLQRIDRIERGHSGDIEKLAALGGTPDKAAFISAVDDFYLTNAIARASAVMAECSVIAEGHAALTAAE